MHGPMERMQDARTAERRIRISGVVFGMSLLLLAVAELLLEQGDLTVRLGLMGLGLGAAIWGRSNAAAVRAASGGAAKPVASLETRAMIVALCLWLLMAGLDLGPAVWGRALLLGVLGALTVSAVIRLGRPPADAYTIGDHHPADEMADASSVKAMAARYTSAWCSQDPASVAAYFAESGTLTINAGTPAVGRAAIAASAQSFMSAFPDLVVTMDDLRVDGRSAVYHWTLRGTNTGPGGTGNRVRVSGREEWTLDGDGRILTSSGYFDATDYARQLNEDRRLDGGPAS